MTKPGKARKGRGDQATVDNFMPTAATRRLAMAIHALAPFMVLPVDGQPGSFIVTLLERVDGAVHDIGGDD